ncbi:MAG: bestrophin family ion channel [Cyanobacteriota bacterium]
MLLNKGIPLSYILNNVKYDLLYALGVSLSVHLISETYKELLPEIPLSIPAFIGTSISILLSFKISQSYERWWEARKIWGSIVNDSRTFVIQLNSFIEKDNEIIIKKIAFRQIAWCYCLGQSLRGLDPIENLDNFISADEIEEIKQHNNKALAILSFHSKDIKELKEQNKLDIFSQIQIDKTLLRLCESQGKSERIKTTVFPVTYRLFLHGIIYLFVVILSLSFRNILWYFEIPLFIFILAPFFLLEKSATHMQDPFENRETDTAMTAIARTIEINIKQLLKETDIPKTHQPEKFHLL